MEITNYNELESHIGEVILFSYGRNGEEHMWMKKITNILPPSYFAHDDIEILKKNIKHFFVYGVNNVLLKRRGKTEIKILGEYNENRMSNAQEYARTPTKEEMKIYMNALRKYRIFGNN